MSYLNSSLFIVWINTENTLTPVSVSSHLSAAWIQTFGMMIFSSTLTTNLTPYIGVLFDIVSVRVLRKKERSQKVFQIEKKYAQILNTICVCCTYGFGVPILFVSAMLAVSVLVAFDKALIAYWFKPLPLQSDLLNRSFLTILKYAPVILLLSTATFIKQNYCMFSNEQMSPQ